MAWTTPRTFVAGEVETASIFNTHLRDNLNALFAGGISIAAQVANDMIYASSATQLARAANGTTGQVWTATTGAAPSWQGGSSLLKANSGTTTNAAAENVDTVAISGLTVKDVIAIYYTMESVTQSTANPHFYSATDALVLCRVNGQNAITAINGLVVGSAFFVVPQSSASRLGTRSNDTPVGSTPTGESASAHDVALTTAWTGAWTLALRHTGVTAGGTFKWTWLVIKIAGQ